jgi:hypothetical protein
MPIIEGPWPPATAQAFPRARRSHIFARDPDGWYVEPSWCSRRLFEEEGFASTIWDPFCGGGNVLEGALASGYRAFGSDIRDRGATWRVRAASYQSGDFFEMEPPVTAPFSIVGNPPFNLMQPAAERALTFAPKVALLWRLARLVAAHWLQGMPLVRVYMLTPRPSMPTGTHIEMGGYVGGRLARVLLAGLRARLHRRPRAVLAVPGRGAA